MVTRAASRVQVIGLRFLGCAIATLIPLAVGNALAGQAPETSPRPLLRGAALSANQDAQAPRIDSSVPLPPTRPAGAEPPLPAPGRKVETAQPLAPAITTPPPRIASSGFVCRDPRLKGRPVPTIVARGRACGILDPIKIREIAGVKLSTEATLNCPTARRVADWLTGVAQPAAKAELGAPIRSVWVMGSYVCRTRNHKPGGKISEHGKGRAIDIGGVTLSDGQKVTVLEHWGRGRRGRFLKTLHAKACGLFHTVLGPKADRFHQDHFHFDTAQRGGRPYCR